MTEFFEMNSKNMAYKDPLTAKYMESFYEKGTKISLPKFRLLTLLVCDLQNAECEYNASISQSPAEQDCAHLKTRAEALKIKLYEHLNEHIEQSLQSKVDPGVIHEEIVEILKYHSLCYEAVSRKKFIDEYFAQLDDQLFKRLIGVVLVKTNEDVEGVLEG